MPSKTLQHISFLHIPSEKKMRKLQSIILYCIILSADRAAKKESQIWTKLISLETITPVIRIGQGKILYK